MLGGPFGIGPAPLAPGAPIPLDPFPRPPVPQPPTPPRPHDPRLRYPPRPSWTAPPRAEKSENAKKEYDRVIEDIKSHNSWRPDPSNAEAVDDYNSEAKWLNTWKSQLEGQLNGWKTQYTPSDLSPASAEAPLATAPPPHSHHPENVPNEPVPSGGTRYEQSGKAKAWNAELNDPLPNTRYIVDGGRYIFDTDANGLPRQVWIQLDGAVSPGPDTGFRPQGMLIGDHAGHLVPKRLGGPGELIDLTAQQGNVNLSPVKMIENQWWSIYQNTNRLTSDITIIRDAAGRPIKYLYQWLDINGEIAEATIVNP